MAQQYAAFDPSNYVIDPKIVKTVSVEVARKYKVLPLGRSGASLQVAMVDPTNYRAIDDLKFITGYTIEPLKGNEAAILDAIEYAYNAPEPGSTGSEDLSQAMAAFGDDFDAEEGEEVDTGDEASLADMEAAAGEAPIIRLVDVILREAVKAKPATSTWSPMRRNTAFASAWMVFCRS